MKQYDNLSTRRQAPFLWGAATSAHQVEGNNIHNDWWAWEAATAGVQPSGRAADHFNRFREDFVLAKQLGHTAHRLSLEWSRIEPAPGQFNHAALTHYRQVLEELRALQLTSFVTLHHFTNPLWLARRGGWENRHAPDYFARYCRVVIEHLGDLIDFWLTINEPMVYASQSYWRRRWPPQKRSLRSLLRVVRHLAAAHRFAYRVIHQARATAQVGIAKHLIVYLPEHRQQLDDRLLVGLQNWWFNHSFFARTSHSHDFIGVNYYFTVKERVRLVPPTFATVPWGGPVSDLGWPIRPEGLIHVLLEMKRYRLPIYVTENGLADAADSRRADFIRSHLQAIEQAQRRGVDVRGYLYWSLLDNFEWTDGFAPRFGLVEVDYKTMERKPRKSAYVFRAIIEAASSGIGAKRKAAYT